MSAPVPVDFTPEDEKAMRALLDGMEREMDGWLELTRVVARFRRAYFDALVEQGFGADQALYLTSQGGTPLDHMFGKK